jgi:hypothetical protein
VRVHRLAQRDLYRWPVQLELLEPDLSEHIAPPDSWETPANVGWAYDQGMDLDEVGEGEILPWIRVFLRGKGVSRAAARLGAAQVC